MIEADQNTEPPPSAGDKEAVAPVPVHPANPAPPEGQRCRLALSKSLLVFQDFYRVVKQLKSCQLNI